MGFLVGVPINPDLSEWLLTTGKYFLYVVISRYKARVWTYDISGMTPGQQYRQHIRSGGYIP